MPSWRARDVTREVDVIEEVARFRLEDVPFTLPARREMFGTLSRDQPLRRRVEDALVGLGFAEVYTPSLRPDDDTPWRLPDPISVELTALRTSLLPSLVEAAQPQPRRRRRVGSRCSRSRASTSRAAELPEERLRVAGIAEGGFLHVKGVVEALYARAQGRAAPSSAPATRSCIRARPPRPRPACSASSTPARSRASGRASSSTSASSSRASPGRSATAT